MGVKFTIRRIPKGDRVDGIRRVQMYPAVGLHVYRLTEGGGMIFVQFDKKGYELFRTRIRPDHAYDFALGDGITP